MTRPEEIAYARARNVSVPTTVASPYSTDQNLWGRSIECGVLEDPWTEPPEDIYKLTKAPADTPAAPAYVEVEWQDGVPTAVNGIEMPLVELIDSLETIAGVHGVGRIDMVENRLVGIKSREIYEAPAALLLHQAHRELEGLVVPRDLQRLKQRLSQEYADIVYNGLWFSPTRSAIDAFMQHIQPRVTGTIRLKLYKGDCRIVGRQSPFALYDRGLATYDKGDTFDHAAAEGFIKIWGLPVETAANNARHARREGRRSFRGAGGEVADGQSLVRTFQRRARSRRLPVRGLLSLRQTPLRRRRDGQPCMGRRAHRRRRLQEGRGGQVAAALNDILERGRREPAFVDGPDEDVHAFVERQLVERVGDLGKRLHTGRSRNEQVSLDLRLYLRRQIPSVQSHVAAVVGALAKKAESAGTAVMPSYTHLRRAMPVLVSHFFLAHVAALRRDYDRMGWASQEADAMPLGSGAVAGTNYGVDTAMLASRLGFSRVVANSIDASSDRDFVAAFLHACAMLMVHLSRLSEDLIIFCDEEHGFFQLSDASSTGSSMMPQKKNPDPLELIRGKSGRVIGHLTGWMTTMKGLASGYNKDLQEDKEAVFAAEDTVTGALATLVGVIDGLESFRSRRRPRRPDCCSPPMSPTFLSAKGCLFAKRTKWSAGWCANYSPSAAISAR